MFQDLWGEHLKTFQEWFIAEESIKADLSLKPKTSLFGGMFGSKNWAEMKRSRGVQFNTILI